METNYLTTLDENNKPMINPTYYRNIIIDSIESYMKEYDITRDRLTTNDLIAVSVGLFENVFKNPDRNGKPTNPKPKSNIPYTQYNITTLFNIYKSIWLIYKCLPSVYGFSILTGIQEDTIQKYVTTAQPEIVNLRRDLLRNSLYDDRTGRIVLANNDNSFGLEYERKQAIENETIKRGLALGDLPQLNG